MVSRVKHRLLYTGSSSLVDRCSQCPAGSIYYGKCNFSCLMHLEVDGDAAAEWIWKRSNSFGHLIITSMFPNLSSCISDVLIHQTFGGIVKYFVQMFCPAEFSFSNCTMTAPPFAPAVR